MTGHPDFESVPVLTDPDLSWGPIVDDIPVPPFADRAAHTRYRQMLCLHLALSDDGGPSWSTVVLNAVIADGQGPASDFRHLDAAEMTASMLSRFPAPWTPTSLAAQLQNTPGSANRHSPLRDGSGWHWLADPDYTAIPLNDGGWGITKHERGSFHYFRLAHHDDLIPLWMSHFTSRFSFPYGCNVEPADLSALAPAVRGLRHSLDRIRESPYLRIWRQQQEDALRDDDPRTENASD
ncbi:hypothetical protein [Gordonia iterans]